MRRGGAGKRRDANEPTIVAALEKIGARVFRISGAGLPDLLVCHRGIWQPLEVKSEGGKLTEVQAREWLDHPFPVVRSVDQALWYFGVKV